MTIFRCKKHFKSEFIQKMIIKYAAFSSFYHKQNFNYLLHMLALQHWGNCQCLPSSDIRTPTSNTGQYVFLAGAYEILSKIPEWLKRYCIATLYLFEINPQTSKTKSHLVKKFTCNIQYKSLNLQTEQIWF